MMETPDKDDLQTLDRFLGCLLGLAVGDALGTTLEFSPRGSFNPIVDMVGGGPFHLLPGQWTDDTSMALCLATSLIEKGGFDPADQMDRYCQWWKQGYFSSTGSCFDIGTTTASALQRYTQTQNPFSGSTDPNSAGNGSLMRLAPIAMWCFPDAQLASRYAADSSRTTHGAQECLDACSFFAQLLIQALSGRAKDDLLFQRALFAKGADKVLTIARGDYRTKSGAEIHASGYVIHTLEAALWAFSQTDSFESAVLKAVNLGEDADTTGAVCGQIAGAYYGKSRIPRRWLRKLAMRKEIESLAQGLFYKDSRGQGVTTERSGNLK
jgi:ADP-ribosyl-[dinitrogen reductase] hydrolase